MGLGWPLARAGRPVNAAPGRRDDRPPAGRRWVIGAGAAITLIAVGAILLFALAAGFPHGLSVLIVGVALIVAGILGLTLSLLVRPSRLLRPGRAREYYNLPAWDYRLMRRRRAAAKTVAAIREDEEFFGSGEPASQDGDL